MNTEHRLRAKVYTLPGYGPNVIAHVNVLSGAECACQVCADRRVGADAITLLREIRAQKHSSCDCGIADDVFDQIDALLDRAGDVE